MIHHKPKKIVLGLLFAILIAAFALRVTNIENIPPGLFPDEAVNGIDAQEANSTGNYKLFYESNNGREGLFINIQAISIKYLGNTIFALKLPSIIFGTLTVLGVFLLTYELFLSYIAALIGAYLITFSYWAINFSRIGFRAIMVPFILTFAFYFLFRGLRTGKLHDFIIAGLIYGLGLHTYLAFRVSPLVLIVLFIALVISHKHFIKDYWKHTLVFAIAMFIASAPMLLDFFVWHPEHYASRTSSISVLNPEVNHGHLFLTVAKTLGLSIQKYFAMGDLNMRHNYPPYPILNPIAGIAFLIGLVYIFSKFFHLFMIRFKNGTRNKNFYIYTFLLAWFFVLLIPEFLAAENNPHALRSIGTLPVVMIIAVIPFMWIVNKYSHYGNSFKIFIASMLIFAFTFIGLADPIKYFVFFANNTESARLFDKIVTSASRYIDSLPQNTQKILVTKNWSERMERIPIQFFHANNNSNIIYLYSDEIDKIQPTDVNNFVVIMTSYNDNTIDSLKNRYPKMTLQEMKDPVGISFYVFK